MSKSMMGTAGGGKVTVEGLTADKIAADAIVKVMQGSKVVEQVTGKLRVLFAGGCFYNQNNSGYIRWTGSGYSVAGGHVVNTTVVGTPVLAIAFRRNGDPASVCGNTLTGSMTPNVFTSFPSKTVNLPCHEWGCVVLGY